MVNVRNVGVGRVSVSDCILSISVNEEGWDGESVDSEEISLLS
jgi:hypothetical protein